MSKMGEGGFNLASSLYTPLFEKGIKETQNKSLETTFLIKKHLQKNFFLFCS